MLRVSAEIRADVVGGTGGQAGSAFTEGVLVELFNSQINGLINQIGFRNS